MKLYMHKVSTASRPVLLFCAENKVDLENVVVDILTGEHYQEPFSKMNPSRQIPVLEDGDLILTESSAILKYLADKINSPTYPKGLAERAKVNELMDWFNTGFYRDYGYHLVYPQVFPNHVREPEDSNKVTVEWGKTKMENWLAVLNDHWLGPDKKYLRGDQVTIADYFGSSIVTCGELIGETLGNHPNVKRWVGTMKALPSWGPVYEVFDGFVGSLKDKTFQKIA